MTTLQVVRQVIYEHKRRFKCAPDVLIMTFIVRDALLQDIAVSSCYSHGELMRLTVHHPYNFECMGFKCRAYATKEGALFDGFLSSLIDDSHPVVLTGDRLEVK